MADVSRLPFAPALLRDTAPPAPLTGRRLDEVAFPLGGLGTGCVSLGGWGQLRDWEIRNRPAKGFAVPWSFFLLRCDFAAGSVTRVLEGPVGGAWGTSGHTLGHDQGQGLPRFREVAFRGTYPIADVDLRDPDVPVEVTIEAFSPFQPGNAKDSGLPAAILIYRLHNPGDEPVRCTVFGSLTNIIGEPREHQHVNGSCSGDGATGLYLATEQPAGEDPRLGTMALAALAGEVRVLPRWFHRHQHHQINYFWEAVALAPSFPPAEPSGPTDSDTGTIAATLEVPAGGTVEVPMAIAWHFPIVSHWRKQEQDGCDCTPTWRNWYATQWSDAWDVVGYVAREFGRLREITTRFRDTLFDSTLPTVVRDAVSSQISILRTPTCLRLPDGTFYGFEGCSNTGGCCEGSCTHVWNYAQALPYLFPELQRTMREADWNNSLLERGYVTFRMPLPLGTKAQPDFHPAADGQLGTVCQVWREYLCSGDRAWLEGIWPRARQALEFAWVYWDADRDGVIEGLQHNTYDQEFYGPNTMIGSLYLAALRAGENIARLLGDEATADEYRRLFDSGSAWTDANLYNGEYFEQRVNPNAHEAWPAHQLKMAVDHGRDRTFTDQPAWQYGKGCLADQLIGQWYAEMLGLGTLYDRDHVRAALRSIVRYNWKADLVDHACTLRVYATAGEAGLLICTWPRGERPGNPFWFADEVWCGIEYQVACHLIWEGFVDEGLSIVQGIRNRYTGERRNPWDEIECGHHYVRSMASYNLLAALSGFRYRADSARLELRPRLDDPEFRCFFSVQAGWGQVGRRLSPTGAVISVDVRDGAVPVRTLLVDGPAGSATAMLGGVEVVATVTPTDDGVEITLSETVTVPAGEVLEVTLAG